MKFLEQLLGAPGPVLTKTRIAFALGTALLIDGLQLGFGPFGWVFIDQGLDIVGMVLISRAIGFHMLLLPTFVLEFIPGPDMLPTWTGCTLAVILIRRKGRQAGASPPHIDIASEVTVSPADQHQGSRPTAGLNAPPKLSNQN